MRRGPFSRNDQLVAVEIGGSSSVTGQPSSTSVHDDTFSFIRDSYGAAGAYGAAVGGIVAALGAVALVIWATLRLAALMARHRRRSALTATGIASVWMLTLALGVQLVPGVPVAARTSVTYAWDRALQAKTGIANEAAFADEVKADPYADVPAEREGQLQLL